MIGGSRAREDRHVPGLGWLCLPLSATKRRKLKEQVASYFEAFAEGGMRSDVAWETFHQTMLDMDLLLEESSYFRSQLGVIASNTRRALRIDPAKELADVRARQERRRRAAAKAESNSKKKRSR